MEQSFRDIEIAFQALRRQYRRQEISRREFIDRLKKLRLRDDQGRFWMIGAQTGKWYYFDGRDWVRAEPPAGERKKVKCYSCGLENDPGAEFCDRCGESLIEKEAVCPRCGARLENPFQKCFHCSPQAGATAVPFAEEAIFAPKERSNFLLRGLHPMSLFFLSGGGGLIMGIIAGVIIGASGFFSGLGRALPEFLGTLQGTLMGGIVFAFFGGLIGFAFFGVSGYLGAHIFNFIASVMGGIKLTLEKRKGEESEEKVQAVAEEKKEGKEAKEEIEENAGPGS